MANNHERKYNMNQNYSKNTQGAHGGHNDRLDGRQEHTKHRGEFNNNARCGDTSSSFQGSSSHSDHNKPEIIENNTESAEHHRLQMLPEPSVNNTPQTPEKHLKYITKVPDQFKSFSKGNPYKDKAIYHLEQAVEVSCFQNRAALYDLACILVQTDNYEKSIEICKNLIKECTSSETLTFDPLYLVNAYNLYGVCCAKEAEAEVNQVNKKRLVAESEEHLTLAVRLASSLASTVPELEMCATDLWKAFRTLQKKFEFEGQKESRDKLYTLCKYISDYRYLEAVDEIFSQDPEELKKVEVIEQCLQRYLKMKAYASALLFRDLIILQPEVKAKLLERKVYKQVMLAVAEGKLEKMYIERSTEAYHPDLAWKQLFDDECNVSGDSTKYDIVIVSDFNDDYELKIGIMSDISEHLKRVLLETFGLNVVLAHEEGLPGRDYVEEQLNIISNSRVSIFILTDPCMDSLSLVSEVADLRISESEPPLQESTAVIQDSSNCCTPEGAVADDQHRNENSLSPLYKRIINASISNSRKITRNATRVMIVVPDNLKHEDLPQASRGLANITFTQSEIETLTATAPGSSNEQCINLK